MPEDRQQQGGSLVRGANVLMNKPVNLVYTQEVGSSSLSPPTKDFSVLWQRNVASSEAKSI
jgi:hypothetical protein